MARTIAVAMLAAGISGAVAVSELSDPAAASHIQNDPSHTNHSYENLSKYRPRLKIGHLSVKPRLYGVKTESSEYSHDVYQYWAWYPVQEGFLGLDSHVEDREPLQVYVDPSTGNVDRVNYAAYHWIKDSTSDPLLYNDTHPDMRVMAPHHQYRFEEGGVYLKVYNLSDAVLEGWLDNGLESALYQGAVKDPRVIDSRDSWWAEDSCYGVTSCEGYWEAQAAIRGIVPGVRGVGS